MRGGHWLLWLVPWVVATTNHARPAFAEASAPICTSSDACASPTPHCHPTLRTCVECRTSGHCPESLVCNSDSGACVSCNADTDCPGERPYCTPAGCVECRTDANCAEEGLGCISGKCGSCGDGTCGARERLGAFGRTAPGEVPDYTVCAADCESECSGPAIGVDETVKVTVGTRNLFEARCGSGQQPDARVPFTAPSRGTFYVAVTRLEGDADWFYSVDLVRGGCTGTLVEDCNNSNASTNLRIDLASGEEALIVIDAPAADVYEVKVGTVAPPCQGSFCPPVTPPETDAGPGSEDTALCLDSASHRGDALCDGVTCACTSCPRDYDDCAIIPGCAAVYECLHAQGCEGAACRTGACAGVYDTYGGLGAPAFRAASALQTCSKKSSCALPCADAGTGSAPDGGAAECTPGGKQSCGCDEGGTGERRCNDAGTAYGACLCAAAPAEPHESSCDCAFSRSGAPGAGLGAALAVIAGLASRRTRRRGSLGDAWKGDGR